MMEIKGEWSTRRVWIRRPDEPWRQLSPYKSQAVYNHSPDGFCWGYGGSGPAQMALAIMLEIIDEKSALNSYQDFKWAVIAKLPQGDFNIRIDRFKEINLSG